MESSAFARATDPAKNALPGVAFYLLSGIYERDYPVVQGTVLFLSVVFIVINLAVDLLYGYVDPRIHHA